MMKVDENDICEKEVKNVHYIIGRNSYHDEKTCLRNWCEMHKMDKRKVSKSYKM